MSNILLVTLLGLLLLCPIGNVHWQYGPGYVYTDNSATVEVSPDLHAVCWNGVGSYAVTDVCIDSSSGTYTPEPSLVCWELPTSGIITDVTLRTNKPTFVSISELRAEQSTTWQRITDVLKNWMGRIDRTKF